jgi:hypothetical protein
LIDAHPKLHGGEELNAETYRKGFVDRKYRINIRDIVKECCPFEISIKPNSDKNNVEFKLLQSLSGRLRWIYLNFRRILDIKQYHDQLRQERTNYEKERAEIEKKAKPRDDNSSGVTFG